MKKLLLLLALPLLTACSDIIVGDIAVDASFVFIQSEDEQVCDLEIYFPLYALDYAGVKHSPTTDCRGVELVVVSPLGTVQIVQMGQLPNPATQSSATFRIEDGALVTVTAYTVRNDDGEIEWVPTFIRVGTIRARFAALL